MQITTLIKNNQYSSFSMFFFEKNVVLGVGKSCSDGSQLVLPLRGHYPRYLGQEMVKWAMMTLLQLDLRLHWWYLLKYRILTVLFFMSSVQLGPAHRNFGKLP